MPTNRKYLSKINKGGVDIYMKDLEAREAIQQLDPAEVASVAEATAAADELT